jgi:hypothetical protein
MTTGERRGVIADATGRRYYTRQALAALLGVSPKRIDELVRAGLLVPPQVLFSQKVWAESALDQIQRAARAGLANRAQPF